MPYIPSYKMKDPQGNAASFLWTLNDTVHYNYMLQYLAETYYLEKDTARYLASLREGFERVPTFPIFLPTTRGVFRYQISWILRWQ